MALSIYLHLLLHLILVKPNCEAAIRSYLPVGTTNVSINAGGQTVGQGTVLRDEYGIVVLANGNNSNPTFISTCKAEIITR